MNFESTMSISWVTLSFTAPSCGIPSSMRTGVSPCWICAAVESGSSGFEGEERPAFAVVVDGMGIERLARECGHGIRPEMPCGCIGVHDADLPGAGEALPHLMRCASANSMPAASAKDEELCHVPCVAVAGEL